VKTTIRDSLMVMLYRMVQINNNESLCWLLEVRSAGGRIDRTSCGQCSSD
jgi:hypothetical protein